MESRTYRIPGLVLTEMRFTVPLDYARPEAGEINLFARQAVAPMKEHAGLPWLVFLQGGPGFGAPRPEGNAGSLKRLLQDYRVLFLDQRGAGCSTPITYQTMATLAPEAQAEYVRHFRADNIVRDAELIRQRLLGPTERWSVLGQSFGGFCAVRYLSAASSGLREVFITGGLPPLTGHPDDVYRATYRRVLDRNRRFYARYPEDEALAAEIVGYLQSHQVCLPAGGILSTRRFQQLGMGFGASNGFEQLHYLLENAFVRGSAGRELSYIFLRGVENASSFEANPIYALLHEAEYCQEEASNWSAERVRAEYPEFEVRPGKPVYFTGEMVYPWMFEDYEYLRPLREAAEILAADASWPRLYDLTALAENQVPAAAAVYHDDMYVEAAFSEQTARQIGGMRTWVTNEYDHNGLRADGEHIVDRLIGMVRGEV